MVDITTAARAVYPEEPVEEAAQIFLFNCRTLVLHLDPHFSGHVELSSTYMLKRFPSRMRSVDNVPVLTQTFLQVGRNLCSIFNDKQPFHYCPSVASILTFQ